MRDPLAKKIIKQHLITGETIPGSEIAIRADQTLLPDSTGATACLEFEAISKSKIAVDVAVIYSDHNTLQVGFQNPDEHLFLQSFSRKFGAVYSPAGNGICHQLHMQRFSSPGQILLGADSHTPTCGGVGMIAIGIGGLDLAVVWGGAPYYLKMPEVMNIDLYGNKPDYVTGKDIILEVLRRLTVKGGVGKILEYTGPALSSISITDRAVITNMGAELGATTSIFPSDEITREFFISQHRESDWQEFGPDPGAEYDDQIRIDLSEIEPQVALPPSPDNVKKISELSSIPVNQVVIGSCSNSFYSDLATTAAILKDKKVHPDVSLVITPGSRNVLQTITHDGLLEHLVGAGARILESACGPCVGVGMSPPTGGVSLRTTNRNFTGRSGTIDAEVFLASTETAAVSALTGKITDPRTFGPVLRKSEPAFHLTNDDLFVRPAPDPEQVSVWRGPNIKPFPLNDSVGDTLEKTVLIKTGNNISTDDIMPSGAQLLSLRSNIPALSQHVFERLDDRFVDRAKDAGGGIIIGGENYGQGSSREHAALAPMYLGVKAVIAKSFARIHFNNLINFGILPLVFEDPSAYDEIEQGDVLIVEDIHGSLGSGKLTVKNKNNGAVFVTTISISDRFQQILLQGGLLNYVKQNADTIVQNKGRGKTL